MSALQVLITRLDPDLPLPQYSKGGRALKRLGSLSRKSIETFLGHEVFLELHVKVRSDWREDKNWLDRFGYKEE